MWSWTLPGKPKPMVRTLSGCCHSAFIRPAPNTQHSATIHCPSVCSSLHPAFTHSIHSVSIQPSTYPYSSHRLYNVCLSVRPSILPSSTHPFISHVRSTSINSSVQSSFQHPIVLQSMHLFKHIALPSIYSFRVQIHPSINLPLIYPSFIHSNTVFCRV